MTDAPGAVSRRAVLGGLGLLGLTGCVSQIPTSVSASWRPNILMLCIDDLNDWVGCLGGHPNTRTPNIDKLAHNGTLFTNAHAQAPLCGPSRASLFTGLLPSETGIYGHIDDDDIRVSGPATSNIEFLPEILSGSGYRTLGVGKVFHLGAPEGVFDEFGGRHPGFGPHPKAKFHWNRKGTSTDWGAYPASNQEMPDIQTARWAAEQLERQFEQPFFLAAGFLRPHVPWYVPPEWFELHPVASLAMPAFMEGDWNDIPDHADLVTDLPNMPKKAWVDENEQWPAIVQAYLASVSFVDHCVGKVLDALKNSPHANKTVVVLWSDHGYHLGEKGLFQKFTLWERSTRVPIIFSGPGILSNQSRDEAVGLIDLYPTMAEIGQVSGRSSSTGQSLVPFLRGVDFEPDRFTITTYGRGNHAIRTKRYRYIRYADGSEELYDHLQDPNEWNNLVAEPTYAETIHGLRAKLPSTNAAWSEKSHISLSRHFNKQFDKP